MKQISGNKLFVKALKEEGVDVLFGYPGACTIDISDELYKQSGIDIILPRHEQALVHEADAYARTTGKVGVCLVTSGPGATNLVTGLATANYDSVPLVCFTGQVARHLIGNDAFQEVDIVGITRSITKYGVTVRNREDLGRIIKEAFYIARTGRPGPVLIDLPKDVMAELGSAEYPKTVNIRGYKPNTSVHIGQLKRALKMLHHCGGVDNIFPHHTNEIAQSESYLGHKWCPYWFHVNHLNDQTGKMSKSKGDFLTVSLLESKGYDPLAYRMFCLQSHYRKPLVFSYDNLDNVESAYEKLVKKIATFKDEGEMEQEAFEAFRKKFADAIRDDLNTSMALTIVYDVVKADISEKTKLALLNDFDQVLALNLTTAGQERLDAGTSVDAELEQFINEKIAERAGAKKAKDFARADAIRDELLARGITIKDTREGVVWERNA